MRCSNSRLTSTPAVSASRRRSDTSAQSGTVPVGDVIARMHMRPSQETRGSSSSTSVRLFSPISERQHFLRQTLKLGPAPRRRNRWKRGAGSLGVGQSKTKNTLACQPLEPGARHRSVPGSDHGCDGNSVGFCQINKGIERSADCGIGKTLVGIHRQARARPCADLRLGVRRDCTHADSLQQSRQTFEARHAITVAL